MVKRIVEQGGFILRLLGVILSALAMVVAVVYFAARLEGQVHEMTVEIASMRAQTAELRALMMDSAKETIGLRLADHDLSARVNALRVEIEDHTGMHHRARR